jgi:4-methyl-5(b-hydroxyethyl)-thiazole monophosphate biosynthesis
MSPAARILVPLAAGFEEIEAVAIIDVLRRADLEVVVAGLEPGPVRGAHGIELACDRLLDDERADSFAMVVLPGGMPGTTRLMEDERVLGACERCTRRAATWPPFAPPRWCWPPPGSFPGCP